MALEAFVGVLFGGIVGAIIFSKVARVQSIAQVRFSGNIVVRYGTGVMQSSGDGSDEDDEDANEIDLPCPILEFRLINLLAGEKGGEIMNASVSVVASVLKNDDESASSLGLLRTKTTQKKSLVEKATKKTAKAAKKVGSVGTKAVKTGVRGGTQVAKQTGAALFGAGKRATHATGSLIQQLNQQLMKSPRNLAEDGDSEAEPYNEKEAQELEKELEELFAAKFAEKLEKHEGAVSMFEAKNATVAVDEGNAQLAPPRTYYKLQVRKSVNEGS